MAYLVKNGADTALLDVNGDSAMHWAAYKGELSIVQLLHHLGLLVRRLAEPPSVWLDGIASFVGWSVCHGTLLAGWCRQVDTVDNYGQTPLHLAAMRGNLSVVEYFVLDADVQTDTKVGKRCVDLMMMGCSRSSRR